MSVYKFRLLSSFTSVSNANRPKNAKVDELNQCRLYCVNN